ncbi:hypothetical protein [Lysinibacillus sp. C5.1]|uniref:hypothetical protein n=1 Tax=Lysinibacillus sp. C5.1 TaxID=2796169 RepID=UPI00308163D8
MVKYYYDKFTAISSTEYVDNSPWKANPNIFSTFNNLYKSYAFDKISNSYQGIVKWNPSELYNVGDVAYEITYDGIKRYTALVSLSVTSESEFKRDIKLSVDNQKNILYTKGSLVQSNITAEDGTYPANGRHSDDYWYIKGVAVNTAPTQPGAFTQPSGTLEIGDSKVFSVGAASDAESNLSKYIWEVSINGAAYSKAGETTSPSFTYTIPTATSLKMRVKAVDTAGLESAYRESSLYTVSKPKYYWNKYSVGRNWGEPIETDCSYGNGSFEGSYKSAVWDAVNQKYIPSGGQWTSWEPISSGQAGWNFYGSYALKAISQGSYPNAGVVDRLYQCKYDYSQLKYTEIAGSIIQTGIIAEENKYPLNGKYDDGFWYIRGGRVSQSIAPSSPFTAPAQGKKFKPNEVASIVFGASTAPNLSLYEVDYRYNSTGAWTPLAYNNTLTRSFSITTDKTFKTVELRVRVKNTSNVYSDYVYSEPFEIVHNVAPTVSLTGPSDNATLYETDTLNIAGTAHDADADQSVTVFYQLNSEQRKVLATNISQTQIALSKQLTFKGGKLYDGDTALTGTLADGVAHTLKVWAEDSEKASSANVERTFYVVPNRAPLLSVDAVVPSGVVDADKFKISGTASDQDANSTVKVTRRINAGNAVEIYSGAGGAWEFELALLQLVVGQNTIVIEVVDNYGAKASKTVTLNKKEVKTPILQSVARYKIEPPKGSAKGVLLFIQRDEELDVKVELSMTLSGEQEQYETLTPVNTAPVQQGVIEDTFEHEGLEAKENIILKITPSQTDLSFNHKIHLISGAVD